MISDVDLVQLIGRGEVVINPYDPSCMQPASYDIHLGGKFKVFSDSHSEQCIDPLNDQSFLFKEVETTDKFILHPSEFVLGVSQEWFEFPDNIVGMLNGKSSMGRLGLLIHATAGFMDAGFKGYCTLELANIAKLPIMLTVGMKIGQMSYIRTSSPVSRPYGSKGLGSLYQGQKGPESSRYYKNIK